MNKALTIISHIAKEAREAEHLLENAEDKQVMVEVRFAVEAVIEANKWKPNEKRTIRNH